MAKPSSISRYFGRLGFESASILVFSPFTDLKTCVPTSCTKVFFNLNLDLSILGSVITHLLFTPTLTPFFCILDEA